MNAQESSRAFYLHLLTAEQLAGESEFMDSIKHLVKAMRLNAMYMAAGQTATEIQSDSGGCTFTGPGRGDCAHFIGLPGLKIPGQHDGPDDTLDAYGKPNGWCWSCWKSHKIEVLERILRLQKTSIPHYEEWPVNL